MTQAAPRSEARCAAASRWTTTAARLVNADIYSGADVVVAAPADLDAEVLSAFGRLKRAGHLTREAERVDALAMVRASRWPLRPLFVPAWLLIDKIPTRDALYVALAASLNATLITTDGRLRREAATEDVHQPLGTSTLSRAMDSRRPAAPHRDLVERSRARRRQTRHHQGSVGRLGTRFALVHRQ